MKTEGLVIKWKKKKNLFWVLVLELVGSSLFSFQQQGLRTAPEETSQLGNQTCSSTNIVIEPGLTVVSKSCKATLVFLELRVCSTDPPIHIYFKCFHSYAYVTCRGNARGGSKHADILSSLARNNSYAYFHYISGGARTDKKNNCHLSWPILPSYYFF